MGGSPGSVLGRPSPVWCFFWFFFWGGVWGFKKKTKGRSFLNVVFCLKGRRKKWRFVQVPFGEDGWFSW